MVGGPSVWSEDGAWALFIFLAVLAPSANALNAYGHAFGVRPHDFTEGQYSSIARRFPIFTVEKNHAAEMYGNHSAQAPFCTNSIAATIGTARKIKAINASVKVLMYWNSALFYNFYECESKVQESWTMPNPNPAKTIRFYNYSVPAFRKWWVQCAIDAVHSSDGALNGLFFDATPKVDHEPNAADSATSALTPWLGASHLHEWGEMVDEVRGALGQDAVLIDNGFFLTEGGVRLAGEDAWAHTGVGYAESMTSHVVGGGDGRRRVTFTPQQEVEYLEWLSNCSYASPSAVMIGHGPMPARSSGGTTTSTDLDPAFKFGLAQYLLVTSSVRNGWFLANRGYSIEDGLLEQPTSVYDGTGLGCGEPTAPLERVGQAASGRVRRTFAHGHVLVDYSRATASINCTKYLVVQVRA